MDLRTNLTELLEMEGYTVHCITSIPRILTELKKVKPGIIILDEVNLNGAYKKLVSEAKQLQKPFVIIINEDGSKKGFEFADACIAMPFSGESLLDILREKQVLS